MRFGNLENNNKIPSGFHSTNTFVQDKKTHTYKNKPHVNLKPEINNLNGNKI